MSINRWMYKKDVAYTYNGILFSLEKKKDFLQQRTIWMNLEDMMLSEISWPQKDRYYIFHSYERSKIGKFIRSKS